MNMDVGPDTDELYNTLKRLSNSTAMSTVRLRKFAPKPIPFKEEPPRALTFSVSEVYFTNGKPRPDDELKCEIDQVIGQRRDLYQKATRTIGTSVENCVVSDMISIDIDPESTRLPMMCKLMIIVEGACVERGQRVLVRDAAVQIGDALGDDNESNNNNNNNNNQRSSSGGHSEENKNRAINPTLAAALGLDGDDSASQHSSLRQIKLVEAAGGGAGGGNQLRIATNNRVASLDDADQKLKINIVSNGKASSGGGGDDEGGSTTAGHNGTIPVEINVSSKCNGDGLTTSRDDEAVWKQHQTQVRHHRGSTGGIPNEQLSRFRSSENLNNNNTINCSSSSRHQQQHQQQQQQQVRWSTGKRPRIFLGRFGRTGSLCDLDHTAAATPPPPSSGYFSTRHADRTSMLAESYLGLDEYLSTPYYQYQCKNRDKKDFSYSTYEDMIELGISIPIRMESSAMPPPPPPFSSSSSRHSTVRHRNERHIFITNDKSGFIDSSTIRTFASNMRRYLTERLSRFEAEVTFFRLNNDAAAADTTVDLMPKFRITSPFHAVWMDCEWCRRAMPVNYSYNYHHRHHQHRHHHHCEEYYSKLSSSSTNGCGNNYGGCAVYVGCGNGGGSGEKIINTYGLNSGPSVTNLMYIKIIDGVLNM